jgi:DNA polymerase II small subunit
MKADDVIKSLSSKGLLISPEALDFIVKSENPEEVVKIALENVKKMNKLTIDMEDFESKETTKIIAKPDVVVEKTKFRPYAKELDAKVEVLQNIDPKESSSLGTLDDFVDYFKDRYKQMQGMLKERGTGSLMQISDLDKARNKHVKIIGIVSDKIITKNGHVLLRLEDLTGTVNVLVPGKNRELMALANLIVTDEVVAVEGKLSKELFIANELFEPNIPIQNVRRTDEEVCLALVSDLHVGSKLFMEKNFNKFLGWLKGQNNGDGGLASKIKYITIAGDLTAGIGIYPGQEDELEIADAYEQYEKLSEFIAEIPEYIHVVISPGNHDAVKKADPQPMLPKELVPDLYEMKNVTLVSSPAMVKLHGLKTLVYHGTSFVDFISAMPGMSFEHGAKIMVEMLKKRHLHPVYGGRPITPEKKDHLVIKEVPDIFHTGESHSNSYEIYRGSICVNSGTWEQISEYQIAQGHKATPCILPVVDMHRGKISAVHFDK